MVFGTSYYMRLKSGGSSQSNAKVPAFIILFVVAVFVHAIIPEMPEVYAAINSAGKSVLRVAIFLIGAQLSRSMIKSVGARALVLGITLWIVMGAGSLLWVRTL
jgi:uncharacterized membrane protein YadS